MIFTIKPIVSLVVLFSSSVLAQKAFSSTVSGVTWLPEPSVDPQTIPIVPVTIIKSISSHLASATANPPSVPTGVVPIINTAVLHTAVLETSAPTTTTAGSVSSVKPASPPTGVATVPSSNAAVSIHAATAATLAGVAFSLAILM
ncbi:hypothetical protein BASA50_004829 [Batrachochytrium salamandrivorans]|uniref:Uncharacterized protein n=1 Tax=Batrachochytrium salamandrivorans TaxID=1357716 RepID=A0ABQ8FHJ1_9FUNG|nr:hypothetical protein BASA60_011368 [Batrachochytrium salamandrivorans]KAH6580902.1 hypothetical protein BASA61_009357 [Batrachochytrium salamandrivorans]KAH6596895.1 hypothetical protein BASA50_004829 [Batrachochytrium salamandrivorans]KAH9263962.1 hypothetical protein BASA83_012587 [Batrachochytrium salamandrivorans]